MGKQTRADFPDQSPQASSDGWPGGDENPVNESQDLQIDDSPSLIPRQIVYTSQLENP